MIFEKNKISIMITGFIVVVSLLLTACESTVRKTVQTAEIHKNETSESVESNEAPKPVESNETPERVESAKEVPESDFERDSRDSLDEYKGEDDHGNLWFRSYGGPIKESDNPGFTNMGHNRGICISKDFKEIKVVDPMNEQENSFFQWECLMKDPKTQSVERPFTINKGVLTTDGIQLFTIPDWVDGKGDTYTKASVTRFGDQNAHLYCVHYITQSNQATPPHDFATTAFLLVSKGKIENVYEKMMWASNAQRRSDGSWLIVGGDTFGENQCIVITPKGKAVDVVALISEKLKIEEPGNVDIIGVFSDKILVNVDHYPLDSGSVKETVYEVGNDLKIKKRPESIERFREKCPGAPSNNFETECIVGRDGTIYKIAQDRRALLDLTHFKSIDICPETDKIGAFKPIEKTAVTFRNSGRTVQMPSYLYEGEVCFCAEDFEGLGYNKQWDAARRQLKFTTSNTFTEKEIQALKGGAVVKSDTLVWFDGKMVSSYCIGERTLVKRSFLNMLEVIY